MLLNRDPDGYQLLCVKTANQNSRKLSASHFHSSFEYLFKKTKSRGYKYKMQYWTSEARHRLLALWIVKQKTMNSLGRKL